MFLLDLLKKVTEIENKIVSEEDFDSLERDGMKNIIRLNTITTYTSVEIFLGFELSGHTDIPTEVSNLRDEVYKRGEI